VADLRFGVIVERLTRGYLPPLITELAAQRSAPPGFFRSK
jgi:hypothetical protein